MRSPKIEAVRLLFCLAITQFALPPYVMAAASTWSIDSKTSKVQFFTKNGASTSVVGSFINVTGEIQYDPATPRSSKVSAKIPLTSISTGIPKRDSDLQSVDYFDVAKFSTASFVSIAFDKQVSKPATGEKKFPQKYLLRGTFKLHGITKPVDVVMDLPKIETTKDGERVLSAVGGATVDQKDFNLTLKKLHPDGSVWINKAIAIVVTIKAMQPHPKK